MEVSDLNALRKSLVFHAADGNGTASDQLMRPKSPVLAEAAATGRILSKQDAIKILAACDAVEKARTNLANTILHGESRTERTIEQDSAKVRGKLEHLANVLRKIAEQNPDAGILEFKLVEAGKLTGVPLGWFGLKICRQGEEKSAAILHTWTDVMSAEFAFVHLKRHMEDIVANASPSYQPPDILFAIGVMR